MLKSLRLIALAGESSLAYLLRLVLSALFLRQEITIIQIQTAAGIVKKIMMRRVANLLLSVVDEEDEDALLLELQKFILIGYYKEQQC